MYIIYNIIYIIFRREDEGWWRRAHCRNAHVLHCLLKIILSADLLQTIQMIQKSEFVLSQAQLIMGLHGLLWPLSDSLMPMSAHCWSFKTSNCKGLRGALLADVTWTSFLCDRNGKTSRCSCWKIKQLPWECTNTVQPPVLHAAGCLNAPQSGSAGSGALSRGQITGQVLWTLAGDADVASQKAIEKDLSDWCWMYIYYSLQCSCLQHSF